MKVTFKAHSINWSNITFKGSIGFKHKSNFSLSLNILINAVQNIKRTAPSYHVSQLPFFC